jgi:hypothetical protein
LAAQHEKFKKAIQKFNKKYLGPSAIDKQKDTTENRLLCYKGTDQSKQSNDFFNQPRHQASQRWHQSLPNMRHGQENYPENSLAYCKTQDLARGGPNLAKDKIFDLVTRSKKCWMLNKKLNNGGS